jgi:hypothetical protein
MATVRAAFPGLAIICLVAGIGFLFVGVLIWLFAWRDVPGVPKSVGPKIVKKDGTFDASELPEPLHPVPPYDMKVRMRLDSGSPMNKEEPWDYLRQGSFKEGLKIIQQSYRTNPSASHVMELGIAYLWVEDYAAAEEHFQRAIKTHPTPGDAFYGMAGAAEWCRGETSAAISYWRDGLTAPYGGAAGLGVRIPLLLFVAAILKPEFFRREHAEEILRKKSKDPRAARWPGSLARFVLGQDSDVERVLDFRLWPISALDEAERKKREEADRKSREWLVEFYKHLLMLATGNTGLIKFRKSMGQATDTFTPDYSNEHYFMSLMRSEEFFLARYEASLNEGKAE